MTDAMEGRTIEITGYENATLEAYLARPTGDAPRGGVVVIHHLPGYDEATKEIVRRFAAYGYAALCPNLFSREGAGISPDDQAAASRAKGGVPDEQLLGDVAAAEAHLNSLDGANGRMGVIGFCSGGRQSFLVASSLEFDAAVDCYGAFVVNEPPAQFPHQVPPLLSRASDLRCPLLGLFGEEDQYPTPDEVAVLSTELTQLGKEHEFHIYPGAGHAFFATDRSSYRPEAAVDGWRRILDFYGRHLAG